MKTNHLLLITTLIYCQALQTFKSSAQTPDWLWAKSNAMHQAQSVTTDAFGNIYVAGNSIIKYDSNGNLLWQKDFPDSGVAPDFASSIAIDNFGNIVVGGWFYSPTITFDTVTLYNTINPSGTGYNADVFVVKYDSQANVLWAKSAVGERNDKAQSVTTDTLGNIYLVGGFESVTITFGTDILINAGVSNGLSDIFIVKYDSNGDLNWDKQIGGNSIDIAHSVTTDVSGNIYVVGEFYSSTIIFDTTTLSSSAINMFVVKYNSIGSVLWANTPGGGPLNLNVATTVVTDAFGNVYVGGNFKDYEIIFGNDTLINSNSGSMNIFITKYDNTGNVKWAKTAMGSGDENITSLACDYFGNVYVVGTYFAPLIFFDNILLYNSGFYEDLFIFELDSSGTVLWGKTVGGDHIDLANSVALDLFNNPIIAGDFRSSSIAFGNDTLHSTTRNMFIAKLNSLTGIMDFENHKNVVVYPNPSNGKISIMNNYNFSSIEVYNILGMKIFQSAISNSKSEINLDLPGGIYFYRVNDKKQLISSGKLIVE